MKEILINADKIKKEPNELVLSEEQKIPSGMHIDSIKKENTCSTNAELSIKTETQEVENEFHVIESASYQMCPNYDMKDEPIESIVKKESEDLEDESLQDPLDVSSEMKGAIEVKEKHFSSENEEEIKQKIDEFEEEDKYILTKHAKLKSPENVKSSNKNKLLERQKKVKKKKHTCPICHNIYSNRSNLDRHMRIHSGEKPFICYICNKSFSVNCSLDRHMQIHTDEKAHKCDVCDKVFRQKSNLNIHILIHSDIKPFTCDECNMSFRNKWSLCEHKRIHNSSKPHKCEFCNRGFVRKTHLTLHRRRHTGEKPYSCEICNKKFKQISGLRYHTKAFKH